jgi:NDP-sugar pyrophosphorylase family protein
VAYVYRGYWIDIGTPEKYVAVHRDIMDRRFEAVPFAGRETNVVVAESAKVDSGAELAGPCFVDEGAVIKAGARVGPYSVIGRQVHVEEDARVDGTLAWPNCWIGREATITGAVLGRNCHVGRNAFIREGTVLGDKSAVTDYTRF